MAVLPWESPAFHSYLVYSTILALKLLFMSTYTGFKRITRGVFANPEDAKMHPKGKVKMDDPEVERVRRAHLNDVENIPAFWFLAAAYLTTSPAAAWATLLFRVYTLGRVLHTLVYAIVPMPQPSRGIAFGIPMLVSVYMGFQVIIYYLSAL